jgi:hypothetical protein
MQNKTQTGDTRTTDNQRRVFHKLSTYIFSFLNGLNYSTNGGSMQEEFLQNSFFLK